MKNFVKTMMLIFIANSIFSQISNPEEVVNYFCETLSNGIERQQITDQNELVEGYSIVSVGSGDIFYEGLEDALVILEESSSGERFMLAFRNDSNDILYPHSFEFTKIPCGSCGGAIGGFYNVTIKNHVMTIPILVGSRFVFETTLKYRYSRDDDKIYLIGKDYQEIDRIEGTVSNQTSTNYITGDHIESGKKTKITVEKETFTNCEIHEMPAQGESLFVFRNSLNIYMESSVSSEVLVEVSYGEKVTKLESYNKISDDWVLIEYGHMAGYTLKDYLLPVPPPMQDRKGIELYMRNIPEIGLLHELKDENGFIYEKAWLHAYGLTYIERFFKMSDDYTIMEQHLQAENISMLQGWMLACALINELDREIPEIEGNTFLDENYYQLISVNKVGNAVEIFFPERAD